MAEITVPIILDLSVVVLEVLKSVESDREDYMYNQGFYDCRDKMISAVENFIDQNKDVTTGRIELINKICGELDCLLTNACDFIFTDDAIYDAVERDKISELIYEYRKTII